jgi:16S rRNA (cytosine967-C5)-methyltransferase
MSIARDYALIQLDQKVLPGWKADILSNRIRRKWDLSSRDRSLAEQLIATVIKNLFHLDFLIGHYSGRALDSIDWPARKILAVAMAQLRFLDRMPVHAAVDQAVEQAKRHCPRAYGFVNAVLRKAALKQWPAMPDPTTQRRDYVRVALSHPPDLYDRLQELYGAAAALKMCVIHNAEPPTLLRLIQPDAKEPDFKPHDQPGFVILENPTRARIADLADRGVAQVQDPTASKVVRMMKLKEGMKTLDRCCGVGTKTFQMAQAVGESGLVAAIDRSEPRCQTLKEAIERRNAGNIRVRTASSVKGLFEDVAGGFDAILIDAPCGNSGVLARRPEARYTQGAHRLESIGRLVDDILEDTADALKPGGALAYSTCSIWPMENRQTVDRFLKKHPEYKLEKDETILPSLSAEAGGWHDGGYWALLRKSK